MAGTMQHAHEKRIEIRWRDMDAFGHVNNAVYLTYLEEVRDEWLAGTLGAPESVWDFVVGRIAIDFRRELVQEDDEIVAGCALGRIGRSSVTTREWIRTAAGEPVAAAEVVLVARDRASGASRPLAGAERAAFERVLPPAGEPAA